MYCSKIHPSPWTTVVNWQGSQEALPPLLYQHSYYKNKTKFLILQVHRLPEQRNPQHRVSVTQMHENLKEKTESK